MIDNRCGMRYYVMTATMLGSLLAGPPGCAAIDADTPSDESAEVAPVTGVESTPPLVASLKLKSGQVIDFYDFGQAALIVESGAAYMTPAFQSRGPSAPDQLVNVWTRLAPDVPVPAALGEFQQRLMSSPPAPAGSPSVAVSDAGGDKQRSGSVIANAPVGCDNGCCDAAWLATLWPCSGGWDYSWFLYNYGWTWASSSDDDFHDGLVCSAQGTSTYSVNIGGSGGTWSVPQATYRTFSWVAGFEFLLGWQPRSLSSSVNSSSNSHLHTYCGAVLYD